MPVTTTFPGIYIEELPSATHTITAAPTSVTVFIGYPHPFKTPPANFALPIKPIELFSFTDYENNFGGFISSDVFSHEAPYFGDLAQAVSQFFLNGGSVAWVVGLQPFFQGSPITPAKLVLGPLTFTAREITDDNRVMQVTLSNPTTAAPAGGSVSVSVSQPPDTLVDVLITYGPPATAPASKQPVQSESYRQVSLYTATVGGTATVPGQPNPNYILNKINGSSGLVTVAVTVPGAAIPTTPPNPPASFPNSLALPAGAGPFIFRATDFTGVMQADTPLDKVDIFNLMVIPGVSDFGTLSTAVGFCERKRAFLIMDPPIADSADGTVPPQSNLVQDDFSGAGPNHVPKSPNAGFYFPYVKATDPQSGQTIEVPPSPTVAGIFATIDTNRGVWKAPAGLETTLTNVLDVVDRGRMTDARQGVLNQLGVNCVRSFSGVGPVVWGARTSVAFNTAFAQWKYVPVRRMALFLEQTLYANLGWVVFEPNDVPLWTSIKASIEAFMLGLFRQGAFQGTTPSQAFQVKCDDQTTTQADIDNGIVNIVVAFAPLKPAEFVIIKISQLAGQTQTS
jgi:phage tail sheath protein FI